MDTCRWLAAALALALIAGGQLPSPPAAADEPQGEPAEVQADPWEAPAPEPAEPAPAAEEAPMAEPAPTAEVAPMVEPAEAVPGNLAGTTEVETFDGRLARDDWGDRRPWRYGTQHLFPFTRGMQDAGIPPAARWPLYLFSVPFDVAHAPLGALAGLYGD